MSLELIPESIRFELEELESEISAYRTLLETCRLREPDLVEMTAVASVIHSFYNGIENLLRQLAKNRKWSIPPSVSSHSELLQNFIRLGTGYPPIPDQLGVKLSNFLAFRHFFRHSYKFHLDWEKLRLLVLDLDEIPIDFIITSLEG